MNDGECVPWNNVSGAAKELYGNNANGWTSFVIDDKRSAWHEQVLKAVQHKFRNTLPEDDDDVRKPTKAAASPKVVTEKGKEEESVSSEAEKETPAPRKRGRPPKKKIPEQMIVVVSDSEVQEKESCVSSESPKLKRSVGRPKKAAAKEPVDPPVTPPRPRFYIHSSYTME